MLQQQSENLFEKNQSLLDTQEKLDQRAQQLETASNYKSQFLANMSHELRTPLNSIILLSKLLSNNSYNSLVEKDIEKSEIINRSGKELLRLINDVLDLSKIEAGKVELNITTFPTGELVEGLKEIFEPEAKENGIEFILEDNLKTNITTDKDKLSQIIRNFISNAFKFTKNGTVKLLIRNSGEKEKPVLISVSDTGIGISRNQQDVIFNAFEQGDNSISRKFGGTGLGLFIAKDISCHLKGEIRIKSIEGTGSEFNLYLPSIITSEIAAIDVQNTGNIVIQEEAAGSSEEIPKSIFPDDRNSIVGNDKVLLIIEDDYDFSLLIMNSNKESGIKSLLATTGQEGLKLAKEYDVDGVLLELDLPDINGLEVLKEFKCTRELNELPVCIISAWEDDYKTKTMGVVEYIKKPVNSAELTNLIQKMIFNVKETSGNVLFAANNKMEKMYADRLEGKRILIVDDDAKNIFVLTAALEEFGVDITDAENGKIALEKLQNNEIDLVLMDIMMPVMDGLECIKVIRNSEKLKEIPIIAVSAKALPGDKEKCLAAGANDYIAKPLDYDVLITLIKAWIAKKV